MAALENEHEWDLHIPNVVIAYRTSVQESTRCTQMFGQKACHPADVTFCLPLQVNKYTQNVWRHLEQAYQHVHNQLNLQERCQNALYDRAKHGSPFTTGNLV